MTKNFDLVISEPGAGKSFQLVSRAVEAKMAGEAIFIAVPTHASKQNLVAMMYDRMPSATSERELRALKQLAYDVHVLESSYNGQSELFIDEIGQWPSSNFNSLLLNLQSVTHASVHLSGDIKQLVPSSSLGSPLEALLRNNLDIESFWGWVADKAYNEFDFTELQAPTLWRIEEPIKVTLLHENHRLAGLNYSSYDNQFFDDIIETKVRELPDYSVALLEAIQNYSAILVATKQRGKEVNRIIGDALNDLTMFRKGAYFVQVQGKTYLNPNHHDYETLEKKFPGVPRVTPEVPMDEEVLYKYWATVHSMQGITVNSVTFFMGNTPIANGHRDHYNENMLYTSVTRASDNIELLGLKESFRFMRHQEPTSPQRKLGHFKANKAKTMLFDVLLTDKPADKRSFSEAYGLYQSIFNSLELPTNVSADLDVFNVRSEMHSEHELAMAFKEYPYMDAIRKGFNADYRTFYTDEISKVNAKSAKGRGKVQKFIEGLTDEEMAQLRVDVEKLSVRKFADKYDKMAKKNVVKALGL